MQPDPEDIFADFDEHLEQICHRLRSIIRNTLPDANERVQSGWSVVSYSYDSMCVLISPRKKVVRLMVDPRGEELVDPANLLKETGRRFQHVDFQSLKDVNQEQLIPIIRSAAMICPGYPS
ncbi:MAG: DUF1801 domain-containing protein [Phycisphaerales bacterium]|nr:DUF1801 domain-containing protein [Phycisphaerales bacterium]